MSGLRKSLSTDNPTIMAVFRAALANRRHAATAQERAVRGPWWAAEAAALGRRGWLRNAERSDEEGLGYAQRPSES